jgi:hypothetical protein
MSIIFGKNGSKAVPFGTRVTNPTRYDAVERQPLVPDFTELRQAWDMPQTGYENIWAVETVVTYKNIAFVRADSQEEAILKEQTKMNFLQKHLADEVIACNRVLGDSDMVHYLQTTEQPSMSKDRFIDDRSKWIGNLVDGS